MQTPAHVFRQYDVRGNADRELTSELAEGLGRAFATFLGGEAPTVAVARDCRVSGDRIHRALTAGLVATGARVLDVGVGPTPLLYFAAHHLETDGAIMVTGSHNPAEDNGFKMMRGKGTLFGEDVQTLRRLIEEEQYRDGEGSREERDLQDAYVEGVRGALRLGDEARPRIVVDAGNGAAGPLALATFAALGIDCVPMHCTMDGRFPNHHPDPTVEENLVELQARVRAEGAPLGVAFDGDGDRIGVVDEEGDVVWGDRLMILFSRALLAEHPGAAILAEVKCSQTLFDDIAAKGGRPVICATGHSLIKRRMKEEGALLAGEMSGHIFFKDRYFGFDDAIYATGRLVELVAATGRSPRALLADVPPTSTTPELRLPCPDAIKFDLVERVRDHFAASYEVSAVDGARIQFGDGAWGLCRASNTGPVLVLRFEAQDDARRDAIRAEVEGVVAACRAALEAGG